MAVEIAAIGLSISARRCRSRQQSNCTRWLGNCGIICMWRATGACAVGTSHFANSTPCQDYCGYVRTFIGASPVLAIAISDGAGSAQLSHVGARATVEYLLSVLPRRITNLVQANQDSAKEILDEARGHLNVVAADHGCDATDLACTTLLAVL